MSHSDHAYWLLHLIKLCIQYNSLRPILWCNICNIKRKGLVVNHLLNFCAQALKLIVYKSNGEITCLNQVFKPVKYIHTNSENMKFRSVQPEYLHTLWYEIKSKNLNVQSNHAWSCVTNMAVCLHICSSNLGALAP